MGGKKMKKKIFIGSIIAAVIIVLATCTPAVFATDLDNVKKITIKTTIYKFLGKEEIITEVFKEEAAEIMEYLEYYQQSLIKGDKQLIDKYESILINSGIFGKDHNPFDKKDILSLLCKRYPSLIQGNPSSVSDENRLCVVNARGKGNLTFAFDNFYNSMIASGVILLLLCIFIPLAPVIGPIALILLLGGAAGLFISHIRPFRIIHPHLGMNLRTGNCSINGLNGHQQFPAPVKANFSGFTGLTVNFLAEDQNVFLLGFALRSEIL
jgi:hypothetical protein